MENQAFRTTEAFISGAICGQMWMGPMGAITFNASLRGPWGILDRFTEPVTFREALNTLLMEKGGDFQHSRFTADTRICVIRKRSVGPYKYEVHVWERDLSQLKDCADLVNDEAYTGDFMGDNA